MRPRVGMVGRFFPGNWRPPAEEIGFAAAAGFEAIQLRSDRAGTIEEHLRTGLAEVRRGLEESGIELVLEMLVRVDARARTLDGGSVADALELNLAAIDALGCHRVHVHLVTADRDDVPGLERRLAEPLATAAALAGAAGFALGLEHNSPDEELFATPAACAEALAAVPDLGFVWDVNHTLPEDGAAFEGLLDRATLVHASDTPLPATNHHLPLGRGSVDFDGVVRALAAAAYDGPIVLEIGGLPRSGGYGKDTDDALRDSLRRLGEAAQ